jgi:hypothetical protein
MVGTCLNTDIRYKDINMNTTRFYVQTVCYIGIELCMYYFTTQKFVKAIVLIVVLFCMLHYTNCHMSLYFLTFYFYTYKQKVNVTIYRLYTFFDHLMKTTLTSFLITFRNFMITVLTLRISNVICTNRCLVNYKP